MFHLAAQADVRVSVERPVEDAGVNVIGTIRVLEAARRHSVSHLQLDGRGTYGECDVPAVETAPCEPLSPYGTAKLAAEEYIRSYNRLYGTGHVALRYGNVYGPRQDPHGEAGVVAIFLGAIARGEQAYVFGDGLQARDYVYVGDVAHATTAALGQEGGVFNVGTGRDTSVVDLYALCAKVAGSDARAEHAPARLGELSRSVLDPELAAHELGFRAMVELEDGLQATWDWVQGRGRTNPGAGETSARGSSASRPRAHPSLADGGVRRRGNCGRRAAPPARDRRRRTHGCGLRSAGARRAGARARHRARDETSARKAAPSPAAKLPRSRTVIMVLNGNGRTGAAAAAASRVRSRGYRIGPVGNAPRQVSRSLVMYKPGFAGEGIRLAKDLRIKHAGPLDGLRLRELGRAQVVYILGA